MSTAGVVDTPAGVAGILVGLATLVTAASVALVKILNAVRGINHELHPNSGKSMRDEQARILDLTRNLSRDIGGLRSEIRAERNERLEADRVRAEAASVIHELHSTEITKLRNDLAQLRQPPT